MARSARFCAQARGSARLKVGFSTGWAELGNYWTDWFRSNQIGGSENMLVEVACALAALGHQVTVRLPYASDEAVFRGVRWLGPDHPALRSDVHFAFDDFDGADRGARTLLVATRSDPPRHEDFDDLIFYSRTHARLMGHPARPAIGGGVDLGAYRTDVRRVPRRVIYTSSPDRGGHHAEVIGRGFDFVATYRGRNELGRRELRELQQTAMVQAHPCDPVRPSEFFCMSILEAMAAGTPCVISDADCLEEVWGDTAVVLRRPVDYAEWSETIEWLLDDEDEWRRLSEAGRRKAAGYDWPIVAQKFLEVGCGTTSVRGA